MERYIIPMMRSKPFGCSIVCVSGLQYTDLDALNEQLEKQEKQSQGDNLVGIMICSVVATYQKDAIPVLEKRGWEKLTHYYSNNVHDYHPIEIWAKRFDRRPPSRKERDAEAGVSILLATKT